MSQLDCCNVLTSPAFMQHSQRDCDTSAAVSSAAFKAHSSVASLSLSLLWPVLSNVWKEEIKFQFICPQKITLWLTQCLQLVCEFLWISAFLSWLGLLASRRDTCVLLTFNSCTHATDAEQEVTSGNPGILSPILVAAGEWDTSSLTHNWIAAVEFSVNWHTIDPFVSFPLNSDIQFQIGGEQNLQLNTSSLVSEKLILWSASQLRLCSCFLTLAVQKNCSFRITLDKHLNSQFRVHDMMQWTAFSYMINCLSWLRSTHHLYDQHWS